MLITIPCCFIRMPYSFFITAYGMPHIRFQVWMPTKTGQLAQINPLFSTYTNTRYLSTPPLPLSLHEHTPAVLDSDHNFTTHRKYKGIFFSVYYSGAIRYGGDRSPCIPDHQMDLILLKTHVRPLMDI